MSDDAGEAPAAYGPLLDDMEGCGTADDPYVITDVRELQAVAAEPESHFVLGADVDASATACWNDRAGFRPGGFEDGDEGERFRGTLDGRGHRITGLVIDRPTAAGVGLVGTLAAEGTVRDLDLVDVDVSGDGLVGALVGWNLGTVTDASAAGAVNGEQCTGGLVGLNAGTVRDVETDGSVAADTECGGVAGRNRGDGLIDDAIARANVASSADESPASTRRNNRFGGLVGKNAGGVESAEASGDVEGGNAVGGCVGHNEGVVTDARAGGAVAGNSHVGGFVGLNKSVRSEVRDASADGAVRGDSVTVGGFAGTNQGMIADATADVDCEVEAMSAGGFVGSNDGEVARSRATGTVEGTAHAAGGFAGDNEGTLETSTADVDVVGEGSAAGGFVGDNEGTVDRCVARGEVRPDWDDAGGVAGENDGTVRRSLATGGRTGVRNTGGLVGANRGTVTRCLAATSLYGRKRVGACVARLGSSAADPDDRAVVRDSYWDVDATGEDEAVGVEVGDGETVAEGLDGHGTAALQGEAAAETLSRLAFGDGWATTSDGYPVPRQPAEPEDEHDTPAPDPDQYAAILADADGSGTEDDPYVLTDVRELQAMAADLDAHYALGADVDASATATWHGGDGFAPIGEFHPDEERGFTGALDGRGHEIRGLSIDTRERNAGLFAAVDEGYVRDLTLSAVDVAGFERVGALCGWNGGLIVAVAVDGDVSGQKRVGGLVGENAQPGTLRDVSADVDAAATETVGGLVGATAGEVEDAVARATVDADEIAGGVAGFNLGSIERTAATATVSDASKVGGIAGSNGEGGGIRQSVAAPDLSGVTDGGGIAGRNDGEITEVGASGSVSGLNRVGGVAGLNVGTVRDAAARCTLSGQQSLGGIVGTNVGRLATSLATEDTSAQVAMFDSVGGVVGSQRAIDGKEPTVTDCHYDAEAAACSGAIGDDAEDATVDDVGGFGSADLRGATAAERLSGFAFDDVWTVATDPEDYPRVGAVADLWSALD